MNIERAVRKVSEPKGVRIYLRAYPNGGNLYFSKYLCDFLEIDSGDKFSIFWQKKKGSITRVFIAKEKNTEIGINLLNHPEGSLQSYCSSIVKEMTECFKLDEGDKSIKLGIKPEPIKIKEYHGYVLYELVKL